MHSDDTGCLVQNRLTNAAQVASACYADSLIGLAQAWPATNRNPM
jgi:hypothetical protein